MRLLVQKRMDDFNGLEYEERRSRSIKLNAIGGIVHAIEIDVTLDINEKDRLIKDLYQDQSLSGLIIDNKTYLARPGKRWAR